MPRVGDYIDDYCTRCKRTTDHTVMALVDEEVAKVICRTCDFEHKYRHNKGGRKEMSAQEAFNKVMASVLGQQAGMEAGKPKKKK
jgi:hypothetical protein